MSLISVIEADAAKVLAFLTKADAEVTKVAPTVVAGLGTVLGAVSAGLASAESAAAQDGLNIALDVQTVTNLKAVWPAIVTFAEQLGIKL